MTRITAEYKDHWKSKVKFDSSHLQLQLVQITFRLIHFYNTGCFSYEAEHGGFIAQKPVPAGIPRDNCQVPGHDITDILYLTTSTIVKSQHWNGINIVCYRSRMASAGGGEETEEEMWELRIKRLHGVTTRSTIVWIHTTVTILNLTTSSIHISESVVPNITNSQISSFI